MTTFGKRLAELRKKYGFAQHDVAWMINSRNTLVSDVEKGRKPPFTRDRIELIKKHMQLTATEGNELHQLATTERKGISLPIVNDDKAADLLRNLCRLLPQLPEEIVQKLTNTLDEYEDSLNHKMEMETQHG